jgi:predicted Zn-dependent protease
MAQPQKSRRQMLEEFVAANPGDAFARYGLALECSNAGEHETAAAHLRQLVAAHPDYVPGFQQLGQLLARMERRAEARAAFEAGIAAAKRAGNLHALSEMEQALADLGA